MRRRTLLSSAGGGGGGVDPSEAASADVCLYDKNADKLIIVPAADWNIATYPASGYSPIGVVVIPGSHNVYGNGQCAVVSLKAMNYTTPEDGSVSYQYIYWGGYGTEVSSLTNFNVVANVPSSTDGGTAVTGTAASNYMPSDNFTGTTCAHDSNSKYVDTYSKNCAPSPYLTDGSRNPMYYQTASPSSANNALSDFNGISNTKILTDLATSQSDWKTATSITNNYGAGYYPAACVCARFKTDGTKPFKDASTEEIETGTGFWYLPACGELGYMVSRLKAINTSMAALISGYGSSVGVQLSTSIIYWSSSECNYMYARDVHMSNGSLRNLAKDSDYYVRAFLRV